jgi:hypothetical protein
MTTTFSEFLREQAAKYESQIGDGKAVIAEWRSAVDRLFEQLCAWLKESDPTGIIEIECNKEKVREQGLGRYEVPRLDLHAFGKWIGIIPKARRTVGTATPPQKRAPQRADGRIDITDELRRYVLYRFSEGGQDTWVIDDLHSGAKPLNKETFEKALMSYWQ